MTRHESTISCILAERSEPHRATPSSISSWLTSSSLPVIHATAVEMGRTASLQNELFEQCFRANIFLSAFVDVKRKKQGKRPLVSPCAPFTDSRWSNSIPRPPSKLWPWQHEKDIMGSMHSKNRRLEQLRLLRSSVCARRAKPSFCKLRKVGS